MWEFITLLDSLVNWGLRRYLSRLLIQGSTVRREQLLSVTLLLPIAIPSSVIASIIYLRRIFVVNIISVLVVN
jgi:hypothetical protein